MKRLGLLTCVLMGLFLGYTSGVHAQENTNPSDICSISAPDSCFSVVNIAGGTGEQFKRTGVIPTHCPTLGIRGLGNEVSPPFSALFDTLDITNINSIDKVIELQLLLASNTTCGGRMCAPMGESITDPHPDNTLSVTCSLDHFSDGKYGVCTQEAVRRYLEWYKVNNCNSAPTLTLTAPKTATQGETINARLSSSGGMVYEWEDETAFISKSVAPQLETLALSSTNTNVHTTLPSSVTLDTDIPLTFSSTGTTNLSATGTVVEKPSLKVTSNEATITINASPSSGPKPSNDLGCNQLLPKYLVGASCDTELKGDASDITYWLQKFSGQITTFIAAIAVLLIAWNAFGLVMAAGDSDQLANGKKALMWVGIGLLLTVFAYVIVKTALSLTFLQ